LQDRRETELELAALGWFVVAVGGLFSYEFFVQFPVTQDFPWVNLLLFAAAGILPRGVSH
jgi:hypothetical protein